jgi:hypothetical protein
LSSNVLPIFIPVASRGVGLTMTHSAESDSGLKQSIQCIFLPKLTDVVLKIRLTQSH